MDDKKYVFHPVVFRFPLFDIFPGDSLRARYLQLGTRIENVENCEIQDHAGKKNGFSFVRGCECSRGFEIHLLLLFIDVATV
jgi:hypothetical protein